MFTVPGLSLLPDLFGDKASRFIYFRLKFSVLSDAIPFSSSLHCF